MVVELALPALLPGLLVALHYAVQIARPRMGYRLRRRRAPHAVDRRRHGGAGARAACWRPRRDRLDRQRSRAPGSRWRSLAFVLIGLGVGAGGTSLLVLLAKRVAPRAARGRGHHRLDDDDRRLRASPPAWPGAARSVLAASGWWRSAAAVSAAGAGCSRSLAVWRRRGPRPHAGADDTPSRSRTPPFRDGAGAGLGRAGGAPLHHLRRSSRCSPTARRT